MTYGRLLDEGEGILSGEYIRDSKLDAWLLLEHITHMDRASYYLLQNEEADSKTCEEFFSLINKRKQHIPLQYISGCQEFMGFKFMVNPDVLIPRQDTEVLVEQALPYVKGKRVLDICTGSGCIGISLKLLESSCRVTASDKSSRALFTAEENAKNLNADISFVKSDLFENIEGCFDVIVSNPPYVSEKEMKELDLEVKSHEPSMALWGGMDGLYFYRRIIKEVKTYYNKSGRIFLETGFGQADRVCIMLEQQGFINVKTIKDYAGLDRVVTGEYKGKYI